MIPHIMHGSMPGLPENCATCPQDPSKEQDMTSDPCRIFQDINGTRQTSNPSASCMEREQDRAGWFHSLAFERVSLVECDAREKIPVPPPCAVDYIVCTGDTSILLCEGQCGTVDAGIINYTMGHKTRQHGIDLGMQIQVGPRRFLISIPANRDAEDAHYN
ncbi:hypothetical protein B0H19DRAFT_242139 [Mycena capillaripes]|nr:hypothetical protein B0H19DRAFT_242139 [Mycena capillaripes]